MLQGRHRHGATRDIEIFDVDEELDDVGEVDPAVAAIVEVRHRLVRCNLGLLVGE